MEKERATSQALTTSLRLNAREEFLRESSDMLRQSSLSLLLCSLTGLLAGIVFGSMAEMLKMLPGLLILIPPANDMRGNIYGAMVSRLGTAMHVGTFSPSLSDKNGVLRQNLLSSLNLMLSYSVILGVLVVIFADIFHLHTISLWELILISVLSGLISASFLLWIAVAISVAGYRRNWNIDNFSSPIITAAGDLVTIPSLYLGGIFLLELRKIVGVESSMKIACLFSLIFLAFSLLLTLKNIREHERRRILIESFPVLLLCGILGIITGSLLEARLERLIAIPAIFVLLPPFLEVCNALGGILSARTSSMLHIGTIEARTLPERKILWNFVAIYILSAFFLLVGALSWLLSSVLGMNASLCDMLLLSLLAGLLSASFLNFASYYIAVFSFKFGLDPDNDTIPLITSLTDIFGVLCVLAAMKIVIG